MSAKSSASLQYLIDAVSGPGKIDMAALFFWSLLPF